MEKKLRETAHRCAALVLRYVMYTGRATEE